MNENEIPVMAAAADHRGLHQFASATPPTQPPPPTTKSDQQQQLDPNIMPALPAVPLEYPRLPRLSTVFFNSEDVNGNVNRQMTLLYDPEKISFSTCLPTVFEEVEARKSPKHTIYTALQHVAFLIYVFRYRRAIKLNPITRTAHIINAEMNIHRTTDEVLQYVEEMCRYYMGHSSKPTLRNLFSMCVYHKRNDFLSKDGTLVILQATTLQILIEISRCVERLTNQSFSSMFFRVDASEAETDYNEAKLWALHNELDFICTPPVFHEEF